MVADAASVSVMVEGIGSRSTRWMQIKRDDANIKGNGEPASSHMPGSIGNRSARIQNTVSSLSSSSGSSNGGSGSEEDQRKRKYLQSIQQASSQQQTEKAGSTDGPKKISSSSGSSSESRQQAAQSNEYHDYHAQPLPDPMLGDSEQSDPESGNNGERSETKQVSTDSSSGEEDKLSDRAIKQGPPKRQRVDEMTTGVPTTVATHSAGAAAMAAQAQRQHPGHGLPKNIAKGGGISHNIRPIVPAPGAPTPATAARRVETGNHKTSNNNARLSMAPAIPLPPFLGIGKRKAPPAPSPGGGPAALSSKSPVAAPVGNPLAGLGDRTTTMPPAAASANGTPMGLMHGTMPVRAGASAGTGTTASTSAMTASTTTTGISATVPQHGIASSDSSSSIQPTGTTQNPLMGTTTGVAPENGVSGIGSSPGLVGPAVIAQDAETSSSTSNNTYPQIRAYYHVNEDDMLLTDDVLMCPYVFRSQDAVYCGALAECIMPGMLRAHFSPRNKLLSLEMVYDAMGFMQQLERASGSEGTAQIVPGSLEMALSPNTKEARVITQAKAPFLIVSVNEAWTRLTQYTQMEVEGKDLSILDCPLTNPENCARPSRPIHRHDEVARGLSACSTNVHADKNGRQFIDFVCSYPLTK